MKKTSKKSFKPVFAELKKKHHIFSPNNKHTLLVYAFIIFTNIDEKKNVGGKGTQFHYAMTWSGNVYAFEFKVARALVQLNIFTILKSR